MKRLIVAGMAAVLLLLPQLFAQKRSSSEKKEVSSAEKEAFLKLLKSLPTEGEFFTEEAIDKAAPHTRVLLALTKADIEKDDIYPFLALSAGLLERKQQREYGVKHFDEIAHPELRLFWASALFDRKAVSPEIVKFLCTALESEEQAKFLSRMRGPNFEDFKKRVKEYTLKKK